MWRDGEADWRSGERVHPELSHQLPHTIQELSRRRFQNHPGEYQRDDSFVQRPKCHPNPYVVQNYFGPFPIHSPEGHDLLD